jgi:hypothetical protein
MEASQQKEMKLTGNGVNNKPDPDIGESDMQLYLREPNIKSIVVWTSSHCGFWFTIEGF